MTPDQVRQLLGGLSAGILTAEEKNALFEAALHDQTLFDEVAGELEFGVFLESPFTRAQLANRIDVGEENGARPELVQGTLVASSAQPGSRRRRWKLGPAWLGVAGALAASVVVYFAIPQRRVEVAMEKPPAPVAPAPPAAAPNSQPAVAKPRAKAFRPVVRQAPAQRPKPPADAPVPEPHQMAMSPRAFSRMAPAAASPAPVAPLTGIVHDQSGTAISNAVVNITGADGANTTAHADAHGQFIASSLPPGQYKVSVSAPGFRQEQREVTLGPDHPAQVDVALLAGDTAESVMVAASPAPAPALPQVAVLDFVNRGERHEEQAQSGANVADLVATELKNSGQVAVVDRKKVRQLQKTSAPGAAQSRQQAAAMGRKIGADAVVVGSVQAPGSVKAEVIDTKKAAPVATVEARAASLQLAANALSSQIQSNLAKAEGNVTGRKGDVLTIRFDALPSFQNGVRGDVFHNGARIGTVMIDGIDGLSATGTYHGSGHPRIGDRVRIPSVP